VESTPGAFHVKWTTFVRGVPFLNKIVRTFKEQAKCRSLTPQRILPSPVPIVPSLAAIHQLRQNNPQCGARRINNLATAEYHCFSSAGRAGEYNRPGESLTMAEVGRDNDLGVRGIAL
jgi:hypothetical protein